MAERETEFDDLSIIEKLKFLLNSPDLGSDTKDDLFRQIANILESAKGVS